MSVIPTDDKIVITVCVPTHDTVKAFWAHDLAGMLTYTNSVLGERIVIRLLTMTNTYIHRARQELAEEALAGGTHYILWCDTDHRFPKDSLIRLLARDEPIVGINYSTRSIPPKFVAIKEVGWKENHHEGERLPTWEHSSGLEEVAAVGGGLLLMKAVCFEGLTKPWFYFEYDPDSGEHIGEDVYFCRKLTDAGWTILVDHDLSKLCVHIGDFDYKTTHAAEMWELEEEMQKDGDLDVQRAEDSDRDMAEQDRPVLRSI